MGQEIGRDALASVRAADLSDLVGAGGIEPLGARVSPDFLAQLPPYAVDQCLDAGVLFALPWLSNPENSLLLVSFALNTKKTQAVELMKFLATDKASLDELDTVL